MGAAKNKTYLKEISLGNRDFVQTMIDRKMSFEFEVNGTTPLIQALLSDRNDILDIVLANTIDINRCAGYNRMTALITAVKDVSKYNPEKRALRKLLADPRLNLHIKDIQGKTALVYAVLDEKIDVAQLLLEAGANVNDLFDCWTPEMKKRFDSTTDTFELTEKYAGELTPEHLKKWKAMRLARLFQ
jgi:ankyrin repeat protein